MKRISISGRVAHQAWATVLKAALKRGHSKRCRVASDASGRAECLEDGRFSAAVARACWLGVLFAAVGVIHAAALATNFAATSRVLIIEPSSMPVAAGTATLTIGTLQRTGDIYGGSYQMKVSPYFFKNEKGRLAIVVPKESLAKVRQGKVAAIIGTATTSGKDGAARHIDAIATPAGPDRGTLKLWFMSGDRKMIFEPAYHFAEKETLSPRASASLNPNSNRRLPMSHREALEAARQRP